MSADKCTLDPLLDDESTSDLTVSGSHAFVTKLILIARSLSDIFGGFRSLWQISQPIAFDSKLVSLRLRLSCAHYNGFVSIIYKVCSPIWFLFKSYPAFRFHLLPVCLYPSTTSSPSWIGNLWSSTIGLFPIWCFPIFSFIFASIILFWLSFTRTTVIYPQSIRCFVIWLCWTLCAIRVQVCVCLNILFTL